MHGASRARRRHFARGFAAVFALAVGASTGGCHSSEAAVAIGDGCIINSDCPAPLQCISGACHVQCRDDGDCTAPARCVNSSCVGAVDEDAGAPDRDAEANDSGPADSVDVRASEAPHEGNEAGVEPVVEEGGAGGAKSDCASGGIELGETAYWCSKVNVHSTANGWLADPDCTTGCDEDPLQYCQKFWPGTAAVESLASVSPEQKPFNWRACEQVEYSVGQKQFRCCEAP